MAARLGTVLSWFDGQHRPRARRASTRGGTAVGEVQSVADEVRGPPLHCMAAAYIAYPRTPRATLVVGSGDDATTLDPS